MAYEFHAEAMMRIVGVIVASCCSVASAQQAELEIPGVFGECAPVYAATQDGLSLYQEPDLRSERVVIPYRAGWRIPAPKHDGLTRVIRIGLLRVVEPDEGMSCSVKPNDGPAKLQPGETVEYLFYVGEGFGRIRFRGGECEAEVVEKLGRFEVIQPSEVQVWLKVYFADGSSPGWLLHDGSQTRVADVLC